MKPRVDRRDVHGWIALDKAIGLTSTDAVTEVRRLFRANKAGHAGTLDPLASGVLPIALGEATKTVPFVMEGKKAYRFTVRWGIETDTDDAEGRETARAAARPTADQIRAVLPRFVGTIEQVPPRFSAVKIEGERAYDLAREGAPVKLAARPVEVYRLDLVETPDADHAAFEAECGKGAYVRALARDLGRMLGALAHVTSLRRTRVGPFYAADSVTLDDLMRRKDAEGEPGLERVLQPVAVGLDSVPGLKLSRADAQRLALGQSVILRGRDAPICEGLVAVSSQGALIALAEVEGGTVRPRRIFNLPREA